MNQQTLLRTAKQKKKTVGTHRFHFVQIIRLDPHNLPPQGLFDLLHLQPRLLVMHKVYRYTPSTKTPRASDAMYIRLDVWALVCTFDALVHER